MDDADFKIGDAKGGSDKHIGSSTSATKCARMVREMEATANGASYGTNGMCWAEFDAVSTGPVGDGSLLTCLFSSNFILT